MWNLKTKRNGTQTHRKRDQSWDYQRHESGEGELEEGDQKVQTSCYK